MTLCAAALPDTKWRKHEHSYFVPEFHCWLRQIPKYTTYPCAFGSPGKTKALRGGGSILLLSLTDNAFISPKSIQMVLLLCSPSSKVSSYRLGVNISISPTSSNRIAALLAGGTRAKTHSITMPGQSHITAT